MPEVSRREFVRSAAVLPAAQSLPGPRAGSARLRFSAMVTFGDWAAFNGVWGEPGVFHILNKLKETGFTRVYWRTCDGCGQASYPSRVTNAAQRFVKDPRRFVEQFAIEEFLPYCRIPDPPYVRGPIDFETFDSVKSARGVARELKLEFYCWHEHAEDHGAVGQVGIMGLRHPEWFAVNREGKASHCRFSLAIPAVMDYRLAWVREVLAYQPDGLYFDFTKSMEGSPGRGCTAHFDDRGVWNLGYEPAMARAFRETHGRDPSKVPNGDPDWVRFRASYLTEFVRRVRRMQADAYPGTRLGLFGCPRGRDGLSSSDRVIPLAEPLLSYGEDHQTLTGEGLLDEFVNAYPTHGKGSAAATAAATVEDSRSRVRRPCDYRGTQLEVYSIKDEAAMVESVRAIAAAGCREVVFFESTPLEWNRTWGAAAKAIEKFGS